MDLELFLGGVLSKCQALETGPLQSSLFWIAELTGPVSHRQSGSHPDIPTIGTGSCCLSQLLQIDVELRKTAWMGLHHAVLFAMQEAFEELQW